MKKARIIVIGMEVGAADDEKVEMQTMGTVYDKGNKTYINYIDNDLDPEKETNTYVKIDDKKITVTRHGAATSTLIFEVGKAYVAYYETRFGTFEMMTTTKDVQIVNEEDYIEVTVNYSVSVNGGEDIASIFKVTAIT